MRGDGGRGGHMEEEGDKEMSRKERWIKRRSQDRLRGYRSGEK